MNRNKGPKGAASLLTSARNHLARQFQGLDELAQHASFASLQPISTAC